MWDNGPDMKHPLTAALVAFVFTLTLADGLASWASSGRGWALRGSHDNDIFMQALDSRQGYQWRPGSAIWGTWISSQGLRSEELGPRGSGPRVAFLGDSVTAGQRGPLEGTLPMVTATMMENSAFTIESVNAGLSGTNAIQQAAFLRDRVMPLNPDAIVWVFTPTHLSTPHTQAATSDAAFHERETEAWLKTQREREAAEGWHIPLPGKSWLREHSLLYGFSANLWHQALVRLGVRPPESGTLEADRHRQEIDDLSLHVGEPWRIVNEGLGQMETLAQGQGIPLVIVYVPPREHVAGGRDPLSSHLLPSLAQRRPLLDLTPILLAASGLHKSGAGALYADASHLNSEGVALCAKHIAGFIATHVKAGGR